MSIVSRYIKVPTYRLMHPESPGMWVSVRRTWLDRLFKPSEFATIKEVVVSRK